MSWCQRQTAARKTVWRHAHREPLFDPSGYAVAQLDQAAAVAFVEAHHYSGSYPAARFAYGLWQLGEVNRLVGVAVLSVPVNKRVLTAAFPRLEPYVESVELGRFVLADEVPANGESWTWGEVRRLAAGEGVRGVVSFSDPVPRTQLNGELVMPGHVGTIYQASNAAYTGRATKRTLRMLPDGTVLNDRALQKVRKVEQGHEYVERRLVSFGARPPKPGESPAAWLRDALDDAHARRLRHPGNHRYVFRLGTPQQRRQVQVGLPSLTYPKKAS